MLLSEGAMEIAPLPSVLTTSVACEVIHKTRFAPECERFRETHVNRTTCVRIDAACVRVVHYVCLRFAITLMVAEVHVLRLTKPLGERCHAIFQQIDNFLTCIHFKLAPTPKSTEWFHRPTAHIPCLPAELFTKVVRPSALTVPSEE